MRTFVNSIATACVVVLVLAGCGSPAATQGVPAAGGDGQTLCQSGGTGTWNTQTSSCTCNTGYTYDYASKKCIYSSVATQCPAGQYQINGICQSSGQCPAGQVLMNGICQTSTSGQCVVGQVPIGGVCQSIANITVQQGCQATGGTYAAGGLFSSETCSCPNGLTYQAAWKSCQTFPAGTTQAQQLCLGSSGTPGAAVGSCTCPVGYNVQTQAQLGVSYQYCVSVATGILTSVGTSAISSLLSSLFSP